MQKMSLSDFVRRDCRDIEVQWYVSPNTASFNYTDGAASERYLFDVVTKAADLSEASREMFLAAQRDWPSRYHLSAERGNLLRWLSMDSSSSVLEIGAGCGAISRHLGEKGARVTAIEGSPARSLLAALRCRDLPNVRVVNANVQEINAEPVFDVVTLIGVLEYAGKYISGDSPWSELLNIAKSFLKPDGVLILAIENRMGLKYWTGCTEDHGAGLFGSIHGYPNANQVQTFSENELVALCRSAGFESTHSMYPWPDYKVPVCILQSPQPDEHMHNWIGARFEDYSEQNQWLIHERLATKSVSEAGLLGPLANSFLMLASPAATSPSLGAIIPDWKAVSYAVRRSSDFWTETTFLPKSRWIEKRAIGLAARGKAGPVAFHPAASSWVKGDLLDYEWTRYLVGSDAKGLKAQLIEYQKFLISNFGTGKYDVEGYQLLEPEALDCLPRNIIRNGGGMRAFDLEWSWEQPISEDLVMLRAIRQFTWFNRHWFAKRFRKGDPNAVSLELIKDVFPGYPAYRFELLGNFDRFLEGLVTGLPVDNQYAAKLNELFTEAPPRESQALLSGANRDNLKAELRVSIVVRAGDDIQRVQACVDALFARPSAISLQLVIVDCSTSEAVLNVADSDRSKVLIVAGSSEYGTLEAWLHGAASAGGELILLHRLEPPLDLGVVEGMVEFYHQVPQAEGFGVHVLPEGDVIKRTSKYGLFDADSWAGRYFGNGAMSDSWSLENVGDNVPSPALLNRRIFVGGGLVDAESSVGV